MNKAELKCYFFSVLRLTPLYEHWGREVGSFPHTQIISLMKINYAQSCLLCDFKTGTVMNIHYYELYCITYKTVYIYLFHSWLGKEIKQ